MIHDWVPFNITSSFLPAAIMHFRLKWITFSTHSTCEKSRNNDHPGENYIYSNFSFRIACLFRSFFPLHYCCTVPTTLPPTIDNNAWHTPQRAGSGGGSGWWRMTREKTKKKIFFLQLSKLSTQRAVQRKRTFFTLSHLTFAHVRGVNGKLLATVFSLSSQTSEQDIPRE